MMNDIEKERLWRLILQYGEINEQLGFLNAEDNDYSYDEIDELNDESYEVLSDIEDILWSDS